MQYKRERLSIRAAVFLGFGLILGLWLFAWMQLSLRIGEAQAQAHGANTRYMRAQETLANIRARVLMASVAFRDALLDPNPDNMPVYRRQLEETYTDLDALMREYVPVSNSPEERKQFARLRTEVEGYRKSMHEALASDRSAWLATARDVLSRRVTPRREIVISVSEGVQAVNRAGYIEQQSQIAGVYHTVQRDLWQMLGLALVIGLAVAILAVVYAGRLEQRLRHQMAHDEELARDLQALSAKLVTVQEQERRHIARELHDEIGQALTAVKVELAFAQRSIDGVSGAGSVLSAARTITDSALHQVRDLSYLLHPAALDEFGLVSAIDAHMKGFGRRNEIAADLSHERMETRLLPETEAAAYRIVQEALNNVAKHARATRCRVRLQRMSDTLRITIEDDGAGFDASAARSDERRGLGLVGIRERASYLKGSVVIDSAPGQGTRLVVELPAQRAPERVEAAFVADPAALVG